MADKLERDDFTKSLGSLISAVRTNTKAVRSMNKNIGHLTGKVFDEDTGDAINVSNHGKTVEGLGSKLDSLNISSTREQLAKNRSVKYRVKSRGTEVNFDSDMEDVNQQIEELKSQNIQNQSVLKNIAMAVKSTSAFAGNTALTLGSSVAGRLELPSVHDPRQDFAQLKDSMKKSAYLMAGGPVSGYITSMVGAVLKDTIEGIKNYTKGQQNVDLGNNSYSEIPSFDKGGVVKGRRGDPKLVMAHAGETFVPTHKNKSSGPSKEFPGALSANSTLSEKLDVLITLQESSLEIFKKDSKEIKSINFKTANKTILNDLVMDPIRDGFDDIKSGFKDLRHNFLYGLPKFIFKDVIVKAFLDKVFWQMIIKNFIGHKLIKETLLRPDNIGAETLGGIGAYGGAKAATSMFGAGGTAGAVGGVAGGAAGFLGYKALQTYFEGAGDVQVRQFEELEEINMNIKQMVTLMGGKPSEKGVFSKLRSRSEFQSGIVASLMGIGDFGFGLGGVAKKGASWGYNKVKGMAGVASTEDSTNPLNEMSGKLDNLSKLNKLDYLVYLENIDLNLNDIKNWMSPKGVKRSKQYKMWSDIHDDVDTMRDISEKEWLLRKLGLITGTVSGTASGVASAASAAWGLKDVASGITVGKGALDAGKGIKNWMGKGKAPIPGGIPGGGPMPTIPGGGKAVPEGASMGKKFIGKLKGVKGGWRVALGAVTLGLLYEYGSKPFELVKDVTGVVDKGLKGTGSFAKEVLTGIADESGKDTFGRDPGGKGKATSTERAMGVSRLGIDAASSYYGAAGGGVIGGIAGTFLGPVGTAWGATVGAAIGSLIGPMITNAMIDINLKTIQKLGAASVGGASPKSVGYDVKDSKGKGRVLSDLKSSTTEVKDKYGSVISSKKDAEVREIKRYIWVRKGMMFAYTSNPEWEKYSDPNFMSDDEVSELDPATGKLLVYKRDRKITIKAAQLRKGIKDEIKAYNKNPENPKNIKDKTNPVTDYELEKENYLKEINEGRFAPERKAAFTYEKTASDIVGLKGKDTLKPEDEDTILQYFGRYKEAMKSKNLSSEEIESRFKTIYENAEGTSNFEREGTFSNIEKEITKATPIKKRVTDAAKSTYDSGINIVNKGKDAFSTFSKSLTGTPATDTSSGAAGSTQTSIDSSTGTSKEIDPGTASTLSKKLLTKQEGGLRTDIYTDSKGKLTTGVGHLVTEEDILKNPSWGKDSKGKSVITEQQANDMFIKNYATAEKQAAEFPGFNKLDSVRQTALINMYYNMGKGTMDTFTNLKAAVASGDWNGAMNEVLDSDYSKDTKGRSIQTAMLMATGDPDLLEQFAGSGFDMKQYAAKKGVQFEEFGKGAIKGTTKLVDDWTETAKTKGSNVLDEVGKVKIGEKDLATRGTELKKSVGDIQIGDITARQLKNDLSAGASVAGQDLSKIKQDVANSEDVKYMNEKAKEAKTGIGNALSPTTDSTGLYKKAGETFTKENLKTGWNATKKFGGDMYDAIKTGLTDPSAGPTKENAKQLSMATSGEPVYNTTGGGWKEAIFTGAAVTAMNKKKPRSLKELKKAIKDNARYGIEFHGMTPPDTALDAYKNMSDEEKTIYDEYLANERKKISDAEIQKNRDEVSKWEKENPNIVKNRAETEKFVSGLTQLSRGGYDENGKSGGFSGALYRQTLPDGSTKDIIVSTQSDGTYKIFDDNKSKTTGTEVSTSNPSSSTWADLSSKAENNVNTSSTFTQELQAKANKRKTLVSQGKELSGSFKNDLSSIKSKIDAMPEGSDKTKYLKIYEKQKSNAIAAEENFNKQLTPSEKPSEPKKIIPNGSFADAYGSSGKYTKDGMVYNDTAHFSWGEEVKQDPYPANINEQSEAYQYYKAQNEGKPISDKEAAKRAQEAKDWDKPKKIIPNGTFEDAYGIGANGMKGVDTSFKEINYGKEVAAPPRIEAPKPKDAGSTIIDPKYLKNMSSNIGGPNVPMLGSRGSRKNLKDKSTAFMKSKTSKGSELQDVTPFLDSNKLATQQVNNKFNPLSMIGDSFKQTTDNLSKSMSEITKQVSNDMSKVLNTNSNAMSNMIAPITNNIKGGSKSTTTSSSNSTNNSNLGSSGDDLSLVKLIAMGEIS